MSKSECSCNHERQITANISSQPSAVNPLTLNDWATWDAAHQGQNFGEDKGNGYSQRAKTISAQTEHSTKFGNNPHLDAADAHELASQHTSGGLRRHHLAKARDHRNAAAAIGKIHGSVAGFGGATFGAMGGAALGEKFGGPIGAVAGGLLGAAAGGIGALKAGKYLSSKGMRSHANNTASTSRTSSTALICNLTGKVRRETLDGREYLVAPLRMLVPGVLNGSKGPLLYPPDEVKRSISQWDNTPIMLNHPMDNGTPVSAKHPGMMDKYSMGFVRKPHCNNQLGALDAEGWFDVENTKRISPQVFMSLGANKPIELSTGLFTENIEANGDHHGKPYSHIARNYKSDHLAVLVDKTGACSLNDGCGVLVNHGSSHLAVGQHKKGLASMPTVNHNWQAWDEAHKGQGSPAAMAEGKGSQKSVALSKMAGLASEKAWSTDKLEDHKKALSLHKAAQGSFQADYNKHGDENSTEGYRLGGGIEEHGEEAQSHQRRVDKLSGSMEQGHGPISKLLTKKDRELVGRIKKNAPIALGGIGGAGLGAISGAELGGRYGGASGALLGAAIGGTAGGYLGSKAIKRISTRNMTNNHIVKTKKGFRLVSHKGKNLGDFPSHEAAAKHEGEVEYFKYSNNASGVTTPKLGSLANKASRVAYKTNTVESHLAAAKANFAAANHHWGKAGSVGEGITQEKHGDIALKYEKQSLAHKAAARSLMPWHQRIFNETQVVNEHEEENTTWCNFCGELTPIGHDPKICAVCGGYYDRPLLPQANMPLSNASIDEKLARLLPNARFTNTSNRSLNGTAVVNAWSKLEEVVGLNEQQTPTYNDWSKWNQEHKGAGNVGLASPIGTTAPHVGIGGKLRRGVGYGVAATGAGVASYAGTRAGLGIGAHLGGIAGQAIGASFGGSVGGGIGRLGGELLGSLAGAGVGSSAGVRIAQGTTTKIGRHLAGEGAESGIRKSQQLGGDVGALAGYLHDFVKHPWGRGESGGVGEGGPKAGPKMGGGTGGGYSGHRGLGARQPKENFDFNGKWGEKFHSAGAEDKLNMAVRRHKMHGADAHTGKIISSLGHEGRMKYGKHLGLTGNQLNIITNHNWQKWDEEHKSGGGSWGSHPATLVAVKATDKAEKSGDHSDHINAAVAHSKAAASTEGEVSDVHANNAHYHSTMASMADPGGTKKSASAFKYGAKVNKKHRYDALYHGAAAEVHTDAAKEDNPAKERHLAHADYHRSESKRLNMTWGEIGKQAAGSLGGAIVGLPVGHIIGSKLGGPLGGFIGAAVGPSIGGAVGRYATTPRRLKDTNKPALAY